MLELDEVLNAVSAVDKLAGTLHNIAAPVDRDATRDAFNRCHHAFLRCRCEARKRHADRAIDAAHTVLANLDALLALAHRSGTRHTEWLVVGDRTASILREALGTEAL